MMSFFEDLFSGTADIETLIAKRNVRGLIRALRDENQNVRNAAIDALGKIGDVRAIEPLVGLFKEEPFLVAEALRGIGAPAFDSLLAALGHEEADVRRVAAKELGKWGAAGAVEPLRAILQDADSGVRLTAVEALGEFNDPRVAEYVAPMVRDSDTAVRQAALQALGQRGGQTASALLTPALMDVDWQTRQITAETLDKLGWTPGADETGAAYWAAKRWWSKCAECGAAGLKPLTLALEEHPYSVAEAMEKLGAVAVPALMEALQSSNRDMRRAAAKSLGVLRDGRSIDVLCLALQEDADPTVRQMAIAAAGALGSQRALEPLLAALHADATREAAAKALSQLKGEQVVPALLARLQDPDRKAAREVLNILGQMQDRRAVKPLIDLLQAPEPDMRHAAIETLGRLGDPLAAEPLMAALQAADPATRVVAAQGLGQLKDSRAIPVLITLLQEADKNLRLAACEALGKLGTPSVKPLIDALRTPALRYGAGDALVKVGAPAVPSLLALLSEKDLEMRHVTIDILGNIGDERATSYLIAGLKDEAVRYSTAEALWKIGVSPELKSLIGVFRERENANMLATLKSMCEAYAAKSNTAIAEYERQTLEIGAELNRRGGVPAMRRLFEQLDNREGTARLSKLWVGIGDWQV